MIHYRSSGKMQDDSHDKLDEKKARSEKKDSRKVQEKPGKDKERGAGKVARRHQRNNAAAS